MLLRAISQPDGQVGADGAKLANFALAAMEKAAPLLGYAQFYGMQGNADKITKPATASGGSKREINENYEPTTTEQDEVNPSLKIMGDEIQTDIALSRRGYTIQDERVRQLESFSRGIGRYFTDQSINGTGDDGEITGLKTLITGSQILKFVGDNGGQVHLGNSDDNKTEQQLFLEYLDTLIGMIAGGAELLIMNYKTRARLKAIAREYVSTATVEAFGVKTTLDSYNGVPILDAGYKKDDSTLIIGNAETLGTSSDCTSVYAVRYGEKENVTYCTNKGVQVKDLGLVGVHYTTLLDFDIEQALVNPKAAARLAGIRHT